MLTPEEEGPVSFRLFRLAGKLRVKEESVYGRSLNSAVSSADNPAKCVKSNSKKVFQSVRERKVEAAGNSGAREAIGGDPISSVSRLVKSVKSGVVWEGQSTNDFKVVSFARRGYKAVEPGKDLPMFTFCNDVCGKRAAVNSSKLGTKSALRTGEVLSVANSKKWESVRKGGDESECVSFCSSIDAKRPHG